MLTSWFEEPGRFPVRFDVLNRPVLDAVVYEVEICSFAAMLLMLAINVVNIGV